MAGCAAVLGSHRYNQYPRPGLARTCPHYVSHLRNLRAATGVIMRTRASYVDIFA